jgi:hypothetical protein
MSSEATNYVQRAQYFLDNLTVPDLVTEIHRIFWAPKVHYPIHTRPTLASAQNKSNPTDSYSTSSGSVLIISSHLRLRLSGVFPSGFPPPNPCALCISPHVTRHPPTFHHLDTNTVSSSLSRYSSLSYRPTELHTFSSAFPSCTSSPFPQCDNLNKLAR